MAIDNEDKRRSATSAIYGMPGLNIPMRPDGDLADAQDRMHIAGFYRGVIESDLPMSGGVKSFFFKVFQ